MGFADRDYVRARRGPEGLGRFRFVSINTWIIIVNVVVFLIDVLIQSSAPGAGVPVLIKTEVNTPTPSAFIVAEYGYYNRRTGQLRPMQAGPDSGERIDIFRDPQLMQVIPPESTRSIGAEFVRTLVDSRTGNPIGRAIYHTMAPLEAYGHFSTAVGFLRLEVWRLVTFQFLHDHSHITHIFFNMFGLWVFGGIVEQYLGARKYAAFYLVCGIFGGLAYLVLNMLGYIGVRLPGVLFVDPHTPLIGASAGVFGVIMACAFIAPNEVIVMFPIPIPVRLKVFAYGYVLIAAGNLIIGGSNAGGDAAHVGGAIAGFFFVRNSHLLRDFFDVFGDSREPRARSARRQAEIDRILQKLHQQGLQSLTAREKRTLASASGRGGPP